LQPLVPLPDGRARLTEAAPAKINLTLRILGRRADGYHELESLVVFARLRDHLTLLPGRPLSLDVHGPTAAAAGVEDNLVLKAAKALGAKVMGLQAGRFLLEKSLPVAAGIGGGSADAAAALRLLARANGIAPDDPLLYAAARATGADVPVCVHPVPRVMRGIGEVLSAPLALPELPAVLVNPGVPAATRDVFAALARSGYPAGVIDTNWDALPRDHAGLVEFLRSERNDLEPPATALYPAISQVLAALRGAKGCRLARMSGSGSTCFGLFDSNKAAEIAARLLQAPNPTWWVRATVLGAGSAPP
jgi:4-diphosphocytidyl-2-C-methyl-D-erythritol kinase